MKKSVWALLCSAAAVTCLGVVLSCWKIVPTGTLSYSPAPRSVTFPARMLALSFPTLPSLPKEWTDATAETGGEGDGETVPVFSPRDYSVTVPQAPADAEEIRSKTYASSLSVNNQSPKDLDVEALLNRIPDLDLSEEGPQILIVHTHTSESYNETGQDWYTAQDLRNTDPSRNMVRMGDLLDEALTARGYGVIHCQKRHDEDFNSSYTKSNQTVREYLKKYPSIAVVIDLHRDSLIDDAGTKYRPTVSFDGEDCAQIMLLMGVGNDAYPHPEWEENLSLALRIQRQGERLYPGLMRPILVRPSRYNQYLSHGAILVELGSCGNTPEEAERAARLFGEICAEALDEIREERS